ncbi:TPA: group II intron maturase-specific domain-containing protein [Bacillus cereus]|uniref:group II intron maturase-specific domain-containing protein n=1 Tax=Bacillus cereus group TaxID=86661 RepID=UPI00370F34B8
MRKWNKLYSLEELADIMNPILRGWANYFIKFCASEARKIRKRQIILTCHL